MKKEFVSVIIVAAGLSSRMNGIDKQFVEIGGIPVIAKTMAAFQKSEYVNEIIVAAKHESINFINELSKSYNITKLSHTVPGGNTRHESVMNALREADKKCSYIAVHDGARPLIKLNDINKTILAAFEYGAAAVGVRVKDTVKTVGENGFITGTPERSSLWAVQTPQVFKKELYERAAALLGERAYEFTDDCKLIEETGGRVYMVQGEYTNIKITTPEDILIASALC